MLQELDWLVKPKPCQRREDWGRGELERQGGTEEDHVLTQDRPLGRVREREDRSETGEQAEGKRPEPGSKSGGRSISTHRVTKTWAGAGWGGRQVGRGSTHIRTYRSTDWRAERARLLVKGADRALGGCRSSIDLLQERSLSNAPSSPFSRPSKSNLEHERTHMRTRRHIYKGNSVPSPWQAPHPFQASMANKKQWQQEEETELGIRGLILAGVTNERQGREGLDSSKRRESEVVSVAQGLWGLAGFLCS